MELVEHAGAGACADPDAQPPLLAGDLGRGFVRPLQAAHRIAGCVVFQQPFDLRDYLGRFFSTGLRPRPVCAPVPTPLPVSAVAFVRGPRCLDPVAATRPIADRPRGPTSAIPGLHTNGAGARPAGWRTAPAMPLTPLGRPRRKRSPGFPREPVVPAIGDGARSHLENSTETPGDLLAGNAPLLDQLKQGIFHFDVQDQLQFICEVALGSCADEGFQGRDQMAPPREPHLVKGPKALGIKLRDLVEGVVAAAVGVAGAIGKFFQLAKHRDVDGGSQGLFQLGQGGDFPHAEEVAQTIGEEGWGSHNAKVPPFTVYPSGTIAKSRVPRPAAPGGSNNAVYRSTATCGSRGSIRRSRS